jgi:cell division transport system permease protein
MRRLHPFYFLRRALANLRGAPRPAAVTASTIAIAVFLFGAFLLFGENGYRALLAWAGRGDPLLVYAKRGLPPSATQALAERIQALPEVGRVHVIPPEEGMGDLRRTLGTEAEVLEGIDAREVLPAVISVGLGDGNLDATTAGAVAARVGQLEGVASVDSQTAWLERFAKLGRVLAWVGVGWAAILGFGALLVIGNSTRLAALTRKEEIEVLRLVGASDAFIVVPFFLEGAIQGLVGSLAGVGALAAAFVAVERTLSGDSFLAPFVAGARFFDPRLLAGLLAAGPLLGAIGSAGAARRFLRGVEL